jgi:N-acetylglucosamine-6-sulfatase
VQARGLRLAACGVSAILVAGACSSAASVSTGTGPGWVSAPPSAHATNPSAGPTRPNIVFVLTDDLTWNLVKYMPHVVALRQTGTTFSNYFVTDSLCCPSRTSIFTGEFPHDDGVFSNSAREGGFAAFLAHRDETRTFGSVLQSRGYQTGLFGKFLNLYMPENTVQGQRPYIPPGWSAWDVADKNGYQEYGYTLAVGHQLARYGSAPSDYLTSVLSTKAAQFIATSASAHRPFLAEVSTFAPHGPFVPAPADVGAFPRLLTPRSPAFGHAVSHAPAWLRKIPPLTAAVRARMNGVFRQRVRDVQSVDRMIGRLESEVRSLGIAQNTYFVFSSDNGYHLGEHNLRRGKQTAFDTDIRVPLIVAGPGVQANRTIRQLTENIDLAPTFESLAGATPPSNVDGRSLVRQLHGQAVPDWRTAVLVEHHGPDTSPNDPDYPAPHSGNPPSYEALRTPTYLYVEYRNGAREYYNLLRDPYELDNRYPVLSPTLRSHLHRALLRMETCHGTTSCWAAQHVSAPKAAR